MTHRLRANLLTGRTWTAKQASIIQCQTREVVVDGGRRFGKSCTTAAAFLLRAHRKHELRVREVQRGDRPPWAGIGYPGHVARLQPPDVDAWVITPRERHLEQCRGYILSYYRGALRRFLHPKLAVCDGGRQVWLCYGGVATRIRFVTGSGVLAVVSGALDILWIDEAGLMDPVIYEAGLAPVLWDRDAEVLMSGTPSLGTEHFFSRKILSGLPPDHPEYEPDIVEPDPEVTAVIGTSYEAYLPQVRRKAKVDAKRLGKAWEDQWVLGRWKLPGLFVYDNWDARTHVAPYDWQEHKLGPIQLPPPSRRIGLIDWAYSPTKPGAAVIYDVWYRNPLDPGDTIRPLVIAIKDHQEALEYTAQGWYRRLGDMRATYGVDIWYCDPSRPEMMTQARRMSHLIGWVKEATKADKAGRIMLVRALLEHSTSEPALYVSTGCTELPRQFASYRRRKDAQGNPTDQTIDYDDHCLDCCAFLVGVIMAGGQSAPDAAG